MKPYTSKILGFIDKVVTNKPKRVWGKQMLSKAEKHNLDKLHRMLCPGNERALIPGLNRLGVLKYNGHESTCYPWTIHTVLKDIASGSHEGYSLEESFSAW